MYKIFSKVRTNTDCRLRYLEGRCKVDKSKTRTWTMSLVAITQPEHRAMEVTMKCNGTTIMKLDHLHAINQVYLAPPYP